MYLLKPAPEVQRRHSVRTLDHSDFAAACASLIRIVEASYPPSILIGIRTGGLVVAEAMARATAPPLRVLPLTCQRPGTATKSRLPLLQEVLGILPRDAVDALRVVEHRLLSPRRKRMAKVPHVNQDEAAAIGTAVSAAHTPQRLLVVDDAVDSGVTLATVLELLRNACPSGTEIRSAVVTVTLDSPRVMPDFALYSGELCRFPWSFDAAR